MGKTKQAKAPRPKSAYNFFMSEKRKEVIEKNPNLKASQVMSEVAALWKNITESEKAKYQKMADEDKERVNEEKGSAPIEKKAPKSKGKKKASESDEEEDDE